MKQKREKINLIIINLARLLFIGLIIFYLTIIEFSAGFSSFALIVNTTLALAIIEIIAYNYKRKKGHRLHWSIWLVFLVGLNLDSLGNLFHFYGRYNWWDQIIHFFISAMVCFTLFAIINAFWIDKFKFGLLLKTGKLKLSLFLAATSTITLSVLYEIEEYMEDIIFGSNRLGLGTDTVNDLVFNSLGVLTVVILITIRYLITRKRKFFD